jgi:hypothetical protein
MTSIEVLLAVVGFIVTMLVVAGMILITPRGQVPVREDLEHPENAEPPRGGRPQTPAAQRAVHR